MPLVAVYKYHDIFKGLALPDGIDKELFIDTVILNCGHFEVLYNDPLFLESAITSWGRKWFRTFEKWYKALQIEYNPLDNYDRFEEYTDTREGTATGTFNNSGTENTTNENKRSAYDSNTYQQNELNTIDSTSTDGGSNETANNERIEHKAHLYGNIGVTTSQQMLQSELDIAEWSLYDHMADLFKIEFTLPIY